MESARPRVWIERLRGGHGDGEVPKLVPGHGSQGTTEHGGLIIPSINDKPRSFPGLHDKFMSLFSVLAADLPWDGRETGVGEGGLSGRCGGTLLLP